jgi:hypothetical protein
VQELGGALLGGLAAAVVAGGRLDLGMPGQLHRLGVDLGRAPLGSDPTTVCRPAPYSCVVPGGNDLGGDEHPGHELVGGP